MAVIWLPTRRRDWRWASWARESGMAVIWLPLRSRNWRLASWVRESGMAVSSRSDRSRKPELDRRASSMRLAASGAPLFSGCGLMARHHKPWRGEGRKIPGLEGFVAYGHAEGIQPPTVRYS